VDYLPICLDLRDQRCVVVGGGEVAQRKATLLHEAGARLAVISPALCPELIELMVSSGGVHVPRAYLRGDLAGASLVIAATSRPEVNAAVAAEARELGVPVNVVDAPELCTAIMPAIVDRSPVLVAITTGGASPVLARTTRGVIERALPERLGELARWAEQHRARVKAEVIDPQARRALWERLIEGDAGRHVLAGDHAEADAALARALESAPEAASEVVLVLAPSDDPERLTLAALRALGRATRVLFAAGVAREIVGFARRDATRERVADEVLRDANALGALVALRAAAPGTVCLVLAEQAASTDALADALRARSLATVVLSPGSRPARA
jgi:uroporphyrin-III C-methyltransferase/precorrin-2 dehydrogenase/sirohydrochlorin ferrochelatase